VCILYTVYFDVVLVSLRTDLLATWTTSTPCSAGETSVIITCLLDVVNILKPVTMVGEPSLSCYTLSSVKTCYFYFYNNFGKYLPYV